MRYPSSSCIFYDLRLEAKPVPVSTEFLHIGIFPPSSTGFPLVFPDVFDDDLKLLLQFAALAQAVFNLFDRIHDR